MKSLKVSMEYIAGIVDGEGSIGIECMSKFQKKDGTWVRKHNYYTPRLTVINTSKRIIDIMVENLGGKYDTRKKIPGRKTCYRWHIFGKNLETAIRLIIPFLQEKDKQAQLVLEFRETVGKTGWHVSDEIMEKRHQLYLKCRELNKVGS